MTITFISPIRSLNSSNTGKKKLIEIENVSSETVDSAPFCCIDLLLLKRREKKTLFRFRERNRVSQETNKFELILFQYAFPKVGAP